MTMKLMIETAKRTHDVRFVSSIFADVVHIHMDDDRPISEIAAEFEAIDRFEMFSSINTDARVAYEADSKVTGVERYADGSVRIKLEKDGGAE